MKIIALFIAYGLIFLVTLSVYMTIVIQTHKWLLSRKKDTSKSCLFCVISGHVFVGIALICILIFQVGWSGLSLILGIAFSLILYLLEVSGVSNRVRKSIPSFYD